ncbi:MAG TPA: GNAT family N-acetyltransferase [Blastocatellia bacterium]|nr:GNAT family N-acetyltransferase [Blastocatellia bacterium]
MKLLIRPAQPEDAAAIVAIFNPIIESGKYTVFDTPFTVEAERDYIANLPARGVFHVAVRQADNKIVGFQSMEPFATYTHAFDHVGVVGTYVDLAERGQGIAGHLFAATFEAARQKGYEKIFTFIRADNPAALATYQRQGFQIVGTARRQAKINGIYVDEIMVERLFDAYADLIGRLSVNA